MRAVDLWHLQLCSRFFSSFQPVPFVLISCSLQLFGPWVFIFSGIELNRNLGLVSGTKEVWESGFVPFLSSHLTSQLSTCFFSPRAVLSVCRFKPWSSSDLHLLGVHSRLYWKNTLPPVMWEHCHAEYLLFSLEKCFYHLARLSSAIVPLFLKITVMLGMNLAPFALAVTGAVRPKNYFFFFLVNTSSFLAFCLGLATQVSHQVLGEVVVWTLWDGLLCNQHSHWDEKALIITPWELFSMGWSFVTKGHDVSLSSSDKGNWVKQGIVLCSFQIRLLFSKILSPLLTPQKIQVVWGVKNLFPCQILRLFSLITEKADSPTPPQ